VLHESLMRNFTQSLHVGGEPVQFLFSPVLTKEAKKYFVTAMGLTAEPVNFEMKEKHPNYWTVLAPAPQWVQTMEAELSRLLLAKNNRPYPSAN
jgi:hypothetical protein